jgi:hypothetical protein
MIRHGLTLRPRLPGASANLHEALLLNWTPKLPCGCLVGMTLFTLNHLFTSPVFSFLLLRRIRQFQLLLQDSPFLTGSILVVSQSIVEAFLTITWRGSTCPRMYRSLRAATQ